MSTDPYRRELRGSGASDSRTRSLHRERPVFEDETSFSWDDDQRSTAAGHVVAHFGDLTDRAIAFIEGSEAIVGCVAWVTDGRLLDALAGRPVSLVVQKEDFLRPDQEQSTAWQSMLRDRYDRLHNEFARYTFPAPLGLASYASDPTLEGVRCVGNHNSARSAAMPRMHHKFLVRIAPSSAGSLNPTAVWTGSFNFSKNAGYSFENAVELHDPEIASAYLDEFARVMTLSEPLDWEQPWVYPEWRIGT